MFEPDPQIVRLRKYADEIASAYEQGPRNWMGQFLLAFFIVVGAYNISLILVVPALAYLAITVVALISIANRALVRDDPPDLVCPDCKSRTPLLSQWTCGKCFHDHIPANPPPSLPLYPPVPTFVQRCAFCRFLPHSLACFNCYRPIIFNRREYQEDRNTISFLTDYPPPPPTPKEEPKPPTIDDFIRPGARTQHTYIVGATGSGKTELLKLLIRSYFDKPCAVVVMDPAGDLAEQVARWPTDRLIYVAHDLELGQTPTINPFEIQDVAATDTSPRALNTKTVVAQQLLAAFQEVIGKGERGDFTTNMEAILEPCIVALLDREGTTIRDLQRFMDDNRNADLIAFGRSLAHYPDTANFFEHHFHHRHYHTTKAAILTKFQTLFSTGRFPALTCGESTIRLERAWEQKKIIVFNLAKGMLGDKESSAFGRLIVALLQGIAVRRASIPEEKRIPCHLFIDEAHNYLCPSVKTIMEETRKFKLILTMAQQQVGQEMTPQVRDAVLGNAHLHISGRTKLPKTVTPFMDVDTIDIENLRRGQFYARVGSAPAFTFKIPTHLLGTAGSMPDEEWERVKAAQLKRYYRPVASPTPSPNGPDPDPPQPSPDPFNVDRV